MSAFIVSRRTMDYVVDAIDQNRDRNIEGDSWGGFPIRGCRDLDKIGTALFALNVDAVNQRYDAEGEPIVYSANPPRSKPLYHYRALACLIYQCCEGDVPARPLYQALVKLRNAIACNIADRAADECKIPWDFPDDPRHFARNAAARR